MAQFELTATEWTQIVAPDGTGDVTIRSGDGQFYASLGKPAEAEVRIIAKPPVSLQEGVWAKLDVTAGITVYAKAVTGPATASVTPAAK